jgi:uncharacterized protein (TIGR03435 family)
MLKPTLLILAAVAASGQAPDTPPAFDVASIRVVQRAEGRRQESIHFSPDSLTIQNASLKSAIRCAWHVIDYQVQGPEWLNSDRFDIVAKSAAPATEDQLRVMLQTLLADRFKVVVHRQTKELQAYLLLIGKNGPKFQESKSDGESQIDAQKDKMSIVVQRTPLSQLTDMLSRVLQTPVVDKTGLTGRYDITINVAKYLQDLQPTNGPPDVVSVLMSGLQEELGLKLESKKTPLDLVIVDHAEKTPAEN